MKFEMTGTAWRCLPGMTLSTACGRQIVMPGREIPPAKPLFMIPEDLLTHVPRIPGIMESPLGLLGVGRWVAVRRRISLARFLVALVLVALVLGALVLGALVLGALVLVVRFLVALVLVAL